MARRKAEVTWKKGDAERIPESLGEGAALAVDLAGRGVLEQVGERLRIRREGGYCGFDVVVFLLLYFSGSAEVGMRKFWETVRGCKRKLAALAGRTQLASPASVSRALGAVETALLRPEAEWLLTEGAGIDEVLRHPSVLTYDARGEGWQVFDFDPTVTTLRHRALPEGDDLPAARRRSEGMAAPGYPGRKRGDVQFRRGTLQHAGSSAWLQVMLGPGNGDGRAELDAALDVMVRTCQRLEHPLDHALLRTDGAFGWIPQMTACRKYGVKFVSRLTRPELFDLPEVMQALRTGTWHFVPDSRSGPQRSALDLGVVTVPPGADTVRDDGTPYAPVAVRVVVSRYPRRDKAEHGRVIDGWQYETFVVDAPAEAFPAADAVAQYFGRAGQENRFAQEDREAGLDRIFSYHLPGQEFATVVGLWVWNLRLTRGFELAPPPVLCPAQEPYVAKVDDRRTDTAASLPVGMPPSSASPEAPPPPPPPAAEDVARSAPAADEPGAPEPPVDDLSTRPTPAVEAATDVPPAMPSESGSAEGETSPEPEEDKILAALRGIDWDQALRHHPGCAFDAATGRLRCKEGREFAGLMVRKAERAPGRTSLIFRRPRHGCTPCIARPGCLRTDDQRPAKQIELSLPTAIAAPLRELLRIRHQTRKQPSFLQVTPEETHRPAVAAAANALTPGPRDMGPAETEQAPKTQGDKVLEQLCRLNWDQALRNHPGCAFDATTGRLRCKEGRELVFSSVRNSEHAPGRTNIIFRRPRRGCEPCTARSGCMRPGSQCQAKQIELSLPTAIAAPLRELLRTRHQTAKPLSVPQVAPEETSRTRCRRHPFLIAPLTSAFAQFTVLPSLFLPAAARQILRTAASGLIVAVAVAGPPPQGARPVLIAQSVADKQHRRQTWQQHLDRYALHPEARVSIEIAGGDALRRLLAGCHEGTPT